MKKTILILSFLTFSITLFAQKSKDKTAMLNHVVLFKFKDDAPKEGVKKVEDAFRALQTKIPQIKSYEWGTNVSPENLNQGFTHCFLLKFSSDKDRDIYLVHPSHKEFGTILTPYIDKVMVVDFWAKK